MTRFPIELTAPVIDAHRKGNTGVDFVHTFESGRPGPFWNPGIDGIGLCCKQFWHF